MLIKLFGYILILLLFVAFVVLFIGTISLREIAFLGVFVFLAYAFFGFGIPTGGGDK